MEGGRAWLADFALARRLCARSQPGLISSHASLPSCILAPEAQRDAIDGGLSRESDVFAFGMLLYELFTGSMPWGQQTAPATAWRLTCGGLRPPLPPPHLLDPALADLIQQCWRQDPASRPTMHAVRSSLQAWLDREGASPLSLARELLGITRASAASAFVDEAAAATIARETLLVAHRGIRAQGATEIPEAGLVLARRPGTLATTPACCEARDREGPQMLTLTLSEEAVAWLAAVAARVAAEGPLVRQRPP